MLPDERPWRSRHPHSKRHKPNPPQHSRDPHLGWIGLGRLVKKIGDDPFPTWRGPMAGKGQLQPLCNPRSKLACTGGLPGHLHPQIERGMLYAIHRIELSLRQKRSCGTGVALLIAR
jgi:hypothetical protein